MFFSALDCTDVKVLNPSAASGVETIYPTGDLSQPKTVSIDWLSLSNLDNNILPDISCCPVGNLNGESH